MDRLDARIAAALQALAAEGLTRRLPPLRRVDAVRYTLDGRPVVGFCSNDYLGLASDASIDHGPHPPDPGAGASRLIAGDWPEVREAEAALAGILDTPDAVLFPSGYQANVSALSTVLDANDLVASDALAHASLIDGVRLSRCRPTILPHGASPPVPGPSQPTWWITESLFSMDGDRFDAGALQAHLAADGLAYVDEAHAFGLFPRGAGLCRLHGLRPTLTLATLGKAYGSAGAAVGASSLVCHFLRTRARGFVFSTGVSPRAAARILRVTEYLSSPAGDVRRQNLWDNAHYFARGLATLLGAPQTAPSPIFPLIVGDNLRALDLARDLLAAGYHAQPIRPPTVPPGTARLRITVSAAHTREQIDGLLCALQDLTSRAGAPLRIARGLTDAP